MPGASIESRVSAVVDAWLAWLPRWSPSLARARARVCRKCLGSPVIAAAGLGDAPHQVQHALVSRIHAIVDADVAAFTASELPLLDAELDRNEAERRASRPYRPEEGLDHEFEGLGIDPEPVPGEPYLFTLAGLAEAEAAPVPSAQKPPLDEESKARLRHEISLADDRAAQVGQAACLALVDHRGRIAAAVHEVVAPQIEALMSDLGMGLDAPDAGSGDRLH
ncbi:spermidine/putrescine ABC transporter substrate-binding protein [Amnibacterium flavum]|uniref:Spermidine/putrescine ABC transporter substrate-binding protein n=1 Tax=Amnibacterium flavum TaxID=2173173 RepID=A0A2V1HUV7_9MICO|nr:spermidine/putrescine ABC transporter substrate-binding protein [Amnibacterium flavum]PVZ93874.1 spermidine/putrescine ABC transporter substrate-binding protein [Amnibacterium flavum]